uniref:NAD(P)(+)--arginine ADP-ribosyltransferase n=1 Tax=Haptolina brevifila TaxID=156173 RepID=A0A7S2IYB1_9EUKA|mmetsp:Transcript_72983/g.145122  ORF Transcript_72983/g.145122 Transcript_72983/m.145122 type:complete len:244 (+) Transcript_72983:462-1193(+)
MAARAYTGNWFYRELNSSLRAARGPEPPPADLKHCTRYLLRSVCSIPLPFDTSTTFYRGQAALYGIAYTAAQLVTWPAFTSVSVSRKVAEAFSGGGVIFTITGIDHVISGGLGQPKTSPLSMFPNEEEVLIQAGTCFRVVEHTMHGKRREIHLEAVIAAHHAPVKTATPAPVAPPPPPSPPTPAAKMTPTVPPPAGPPMPVPAPEQAPRPDEPAGEWQSPEEPKQQIRRRCRWRFCRASPPKD